MCGKNGIQDKGATIRLGAYPCHLADGSLAARVYGAANISERHRHRFEVNNEYRGELERAGMRLSGVSPDQLLVEMIETSRKLISVPLSPGRPHSHAPDTAKSLVGSRHGAHNSPSLQTPRSRKVTASGFADWAM